MTLPGLSLRTYILWDKSRASSTSWVTSTMVFPQDSHTPISHSCMWDLVMASRAPKGSSRRIMDWPARIGRRKAALCLIPPEREEGYWFSKPRSPNLSRSSWARRRASERSIPWTSRPRMAFSMTVLQGSRRSFCSMYPTTPSLPLAGPPSNHMDPSLGSSRPAMIFSRVLFPQPLGPMMLTNSPSSAKKSTFSRTGRFLPFRGKYLLIPSTWILAFTAGCVRLFCCDMLIADQKRPGRLPCRVGGLAHHSRFRIPTLVLSRSGS